MPKSAWDTAEEKYRAKPVPAAWDAAETLYGQEAKRQAMEELQQSHANAAGGMEGVAKSIIGGVQGLGHAIQRVAAPAEDPMGAQARAVAGAVGGPIAGALGPLIGDVVLGQYAQAQKAKQAYDEGDPLKAAGYGAAAVVPVAGPGAVAAGEKIQEGKWAEGITDALQLIGPAGLKSVGALPEAMNVRVPFMRNPNAAKAAAVDSALAKGMHVPAGVATGNPLVGSLEKFVEHSPAGSIITSRAKAKFAGELAREGEALAQRAHPTEMMTPETAGSAVREGMEGAISDLKKAADAEFEPTNAIFNDPKNVQQIRVGTREEITGYQSNGLPIRKVVPVTEDMAVPVDARQIKAMAAPIVERFKKIWNKADRESSQAFAILESILDGGDFIPGQSAKDALSGLKAIVREADLPELKNLSQGVTARIVPKLQAELESSLAKVGGQDAVKSWRQGNELHAQKMEAAETLRKMNDEPVKLFNQMTERKDAGLKKVQTIAEFAPQEMPKVSRAFMEDLLSTATKEGGFDKTSEIANRWHNLGDATKKIMFKDPKLIHAIDEFFLVGKAPKAQSVTAYAAGGVGGLGVLWYGGPGAAIAYTVGTGALATLFHNPTFVRTLTRGMRVPIKSPAGIATAGKLMDLAGDEAEPYLGSFAAGYRAEKKSPPVN